MYKTGTHLHYSIGIGQEEVLVQAVVGYYISQ